jgi:hypothetical protein
VPQIRHLPDVRPYLRRAISYLSTRRAGTDEESTMFEIDRTYLDYELAYRAERLKGERPDQHHDGHRMLRPVRRRKDGDRNRRAA